MSATALAVAPEDPRTPDARALVGALDAYLDALYPPENNYLLDVESLRDPAVTFFVARAGGHAGEALGCAALRALDGSTGELKRMYVRPEARGRGVGGALLDAVEARARALGLAQLKLETGTAQPEALALYRARGFARCEPFGEYAAHPLNEFYAKAL